MYPLADQTFKEEMNKLKANYGQDKFPSALTSMIWDELKEFSPKQIRSICDFVTRSYEGTPRINAFRNGASMLREKIRQFEREQQRQEAKDFWEGTYHPNEVKAIVQTIKLRLEGKVTDDEYKQFQEMLLSSSEMNEAF
jgi:hypothetical protein